MSEPSKTFGYSRVRLRPHIKDSTLVAGYRGMISNNYVMDAKGSWHAQKYLSLRHTQSILGSCLITYAQNKGLARSAQGFNAPAACTLAMWHKAIIAPSASIQFFNLFKDATNGWGLYYAITSGNYSILDDLNNAGASRYSTGVAKGWHHVACTINGSTNEQKLYIDGELRGSGTNAGASLTTVSNAYIYLLGATSLTTSPPGGFALAEVYNEEKSLAQIQRLYYEGARAVQFKTEWGHLVSATNEGVNSRLGRGPLRVMSGTFVVEVETIAGKDVKVVRCVTDGEFALPTAVMQADPVEAAFGTWDFWVNKADASTMRILFISDQPATTTANGYSFNFTSTEAVSSSEYNAGGLTTKMGTGAAYATAGAWHRIRVTNSYANPNSKTFYVDGVAVVATTGTNPYGDSTTAQSKYMVFQMDAGDKVALSAIDGSYAIKKYLGVLPVTIG